MPYFLSKAVVIREILPNSIQCWVYRGHGFHSNVLGKQTDSDC